MAAKKQTKKKAKTVATTSAPANAITPLQQRYLDARKVILATVAERQAARRAEGSAAKQLLQDDKIKFELSVRCSLGEQIWNAPISDFRTAYASEEPESDSEPSAAGPSRPPRSRTAAAKLTSRPATSRATRANRALPADPATVAPAKGLRGGRVMRGTVLRNAVAPTPFGTALHAGGIPRVITNDMIFPALRKPDGEIIDATAWDESELANDAELVGALQLINNRIRMRAEADRDA